MKYLVCFEKGDSARWLGHLDVMRAFERALRRAGLPVAYSAGFNPRPRLSFASALPVGVTAGADPAIVELTQPLDAGDLVRRLNDVLPGGLRVREAHTIPDEGSRDLLNSFRRATLDVVCAAPPDLDERRAREAVDGLLAQPELWVERRRDGRVRRIDARPFIERMEISDVQDDRLALSLVLRVSQEGAVRADELVGLLARDVPGLAVRRVHRAKLERGEG